MTVTEFAKLPGPSPAAQALKHELSQIILWNEQNSPRSKQQAVGPSELGDPCDRRLAYRIAGAAPVNIWADPWPAIVGTSVHDWLERAINRYQLAHGDQGWLTELRVYPDPLVRGRSDIFKHTEGLIVDWKAQPLDELILTPVGWRKMGDLSPGDEVIGSSGKAIKVLGTYPLGEARVYRVETSDHTYVEATADHLWTVLSKDLQRTKVLTTSDLATELNKKQPYYCVLPLLNPVEFCGMDESLPIEPYGLGLLIGDGSMRGESVTFSNPDGLEKFLPFGTSLHYDSSGRRCRTFGVLGAVPKLKEIGLFDHLSVDKFIPEPYLRASVSDRLALLQGLMDTDGCLQKNRAAFCTSSQRLADDFIELVQSLGGKAFDHIDKKLRKGATHLAHLITFKLPEDMVPFRADLPQKKGKWVRGVEGHQRIIKSVTPTRVTSVQCINVDAEDGLYVTRGYLLTHNTAGADVMRKLHKGQIPEGYRTQVQIYGLGHKRAGRDVRNVALVFLPRSGWLDDMLVHIEPYSEDVAIAALDRMYRIGEELIRIDIENNPHRYEFIDSSPGDNCVWCPFYSREKDPDMVADDKGCPGR